MALAYAPDCTSPFHKRGEFVPDDQLPESTLADRVRSLRKARGLSQDALARAVGVTKNQVSLVEKGVTKALQPWTLERYAEVLGTSQDYLRGGFVTPPGGNGQWPDIEMWTRGRGELQDEEHIRYLRETYAMLVELERGAAEGEGNES